MVASATEMRRTRRRSSRSTKTRRLNNGLIIVLLSAPHLLYREIKKGGRLAPRNPDVLLFIYALERAFPPFRRFNILPACERAAPQPANTRCFHHVLPASARPSWGCYAAIFRLFYRSDQTNTKDFKWMWKTPVKVVKVHTLSVFRFNSSLCGFFYTVGINRGGSSPLSLKDGWIKPSRDE